MGTRAGLDVCGKSRLTETLSPDHPACSQLLYRLSSFQPSFIGTTFQLTQGVPSFNKFVPTLYDAYILKIRVTRY